MGRAHWVLYFYAVSIPLMSAGIYISAHYGLNAVAIPWLTIYPLLCVAWTALTLKKLEIPSLRYLRSSSINVLASLLIVVGVKLVLVAIASPMPRCTTGWCWRRNWRWRRSPTFSGSGFASVRPSSTCGT